MHSAEQRSLWPVLITIAFGLTLFFLAQATHNIDPPEDAYITFRYARHLAEGHGLVWNPGEDPVEGSTEFLWAVLVAGMHRLGLAIESGARALNLLFGSLAVILMAVASYSLSGRRLLISLFATGAFAAGPVAYHVRSGFATTLFTLLIALMFVSSVLLVLAPADHRGRRWAFPTLALTGLLMGMTRPEGVLYAGLTLLALFVLLDRPWRRRLLIVVALLFVLPGLIYFIWRWQYFGYFLPNTFYVKSSGNLLHLRYFFDIYNLFAFVAPLFLIIGLALMQSSKQRGWTNLVLLIPALVFPWAYLLIAQLQNLGYRFQYPVYPVYLLAAAVALATLIPPGKLDIKQVPWRQHVAFIVGLGLALFGLFVPLERSVLVLAIIVTLTVMQWFRRQAWFPDRQIQMATAILLLALTLLSTFQSYDLASRFHFTRYDDLKAAGDALRPFADEGFTLVTTEAGWLPYFSTWRAIDSFGLNDETIAHQGLSPTYLDQVAPDVILYHEVANPDHPSWETMVQILETYARTRDYVLAAVVERFGPQDLHVYYVRGDNPQATSLIEALTTLPGASYQYRAP